MRISDWSSDVCSSDLVERVAGGAGVVPGDLRAERDRIGRGRGHVADRCRGRGRRERKSVVEGKSVSVRVALGGSRNIKKNKNTIPDCSQPTTLLLRHEINTSPTYTAR